MHRLCSSDLLNQPLRKRFRYVNETLCDLIRKAAPEAFLFGAILDFFARVNRENILHTTLDFSSFEFWLNHFSGLSESDNYELRAKIVGKHLPREDYQAFFPVGMGKVYPGSHFIAAHLSPDIDTMIASFWGWMDAFGARISSGLHFWCLPGGPPESPVTTIFRNMLGTSVFLYLARTSPSLTLTAMDLLRPQALTKALGHTTVNAIDSQCEDHPLLLVDEQGHYLGEWRPADAQLIRQILIPFKSCLRWFENNLHTRLITLFAKELVSIHDFPALYASIFDVSLKTCEPIHELNEAQITYLHDFLSRVLGVTDGLNGTFRDLHRTFASLSVPHLMDFQNTLEALPLSDIFDPEGRLKEERPRIFDRLTALIRQLDEAMLHVRNYVERLDILLSIKHKILGCPQVYLTLASDVDEMRNKMQHHHFLTVVIHDQDGSLFPVGVIQAQDLQGSRLGTVTLRDFCNADEVRMAPYLEVISVVDHHKSSFKTSSVATALIGDAQSCNVIIAERAFALNDRYSLGGMHPDKIEAQIEAISSQSTTPSNIRLLRRLLNRRLAGLQRGIFYVHPEREYKEYMCLLYAILDDTDLLTKASYRDVVCVAELLNRLKSLSLHREVEIIAFDDLPRNSHFIKAAALRILQQEDMHSLYQQVYRFREAEVESHLQRCIVGQNSSIFLDTKEQNGCARVGQTKIFASNFPFFTTRVQQLRQIWLRESSEAHQKNPKSISTST